VIPMADEEKPAKTFEERRSESLKQNTHDEDSIKKLNATFTLKEVPDGDDEASRAAQMAYCSELAEEIIKTIDGISKHLENDFVMLKEQIRNTHTTEILTWENPTDTRRIVISDAKFTEKRLRAIFKDMSWATGQMQHMFNFLEEQAKESLLDKGKRAVRGAPKAILSTPFVIGKKLIGKGEKHRVN